MGRLKKHTTSEIQKDGRKETLFKTDQASRKKRGLKRETRDKQD